MTGVAGVRGYLKSRLLVLAYGGSIGICMVGLALTEFADCICVTILSGLVSSVGLRLEGTAVARIMGLYLS